MDPALERSGSLIDARNREILAEYLGRLEQLNYSPNTIRVRRSATKTLLSMCPSVPLEFITAEHVARRVQRPSRASARTKAAELYHIRAFFKYVVENTRLLNENPCGSAGRDAPAGCFWIGAVARMTGVTLKRLREMDRVVHPERSPRGHRLYTQSQVDQIMQHAKQPTAMKRGDPEPKVRRDAKARIRRDAEAKVRRDAETKVRRDADGRVIWRL